LHCCILQKLGAACTLVWRLWIWIYQWISMNISLDIHGKSGYGYVWEISYPRQACCFEMRYNILTNPVFSEIVKNKKISVLPVASGKKIGMGKLDYVYFIKFCKTTTH